MATKNASNTNTTHPISIGSRVRISAGTKVTKRGATAARQRPSTVTVCTATPARYNKTRITWMSGGYAVSALV